MAFALEGGDFPGLAHRREAIGQISTDAMKKGENIPVRVRWALLRFSVVGPLLACPPESGELTSQLDEVASRAYAYPTTRERVRFGRSNHRTLAVSKLLTTGSPA